MNTHARLWPEASRTPLAAGLEPGAETGSARLVPTGLFRHFDSWLGHPAWLRAGTSLGPGLLPLFLPLADALRLAENVTDHGHEGQLIDLLLAQQGTPTNPVAAGLLDQARTAGDGLLALARYVNVTHHHLLFSADAGQRQWSLEMSTRLPLSHRSFILFGATLVAVLVRYLQRFGRIEPDQISIAMPGLASLLAGRLGITIAEQAGSTISIALAKELALRENPGHDPQLWQLSVDRLVGLERAASRPELISRLEDFISEILSRQRRVPALTEAARGLGMSDRTLSRQLADLGIGLRDVADRVRERRARQLIGVTTLDIDEIAAQLGYPDRTSFSRRFRNWFGTSPADYRNRHSSDA